MLWNWEDMALATNFLRPSEILEREGFLTAKEVENDLNCEFLLWNPISNPVHSLAGWAGCGLRGRGNHRRNGTLALTAIPISNPVHSPAGWAGGELGASPGKPQDKRNTCSYSYCYLAPTFNVMYNDIWLFYRDHQMQLSVFQTNESI